MSKVSKRDSIINAALELFSANGYTDTTTKLIADKAGVNEVTIFRHFGNKDSLFQEVTKNYVESLGSNTNVATYKKLMPKETINAIGTEYISYCFDNEQIYKIQMKMHEDILNTSKLRLSKAYISELTKYLSSLKEEGIFKGNPEVAATNFILSILGVFTFYVLTNEFSKEQVENLVSQQVDNFIEYNEL